jgi:hypothetical protein
MSLGGFLQTIFRPLFNSSSSFSVRLPGNRYKEERNLVCNLFLARSQPCRVSINVTQKENQSNHVHFIRYDSKNNVELTYQLISETQIKVFCFQLVAYSTLGGVGWGDAEEGSSQANVGEMHQHLA